MNSGFSPDDSRVGACECVSVPEHVHLHGARGGASWLHTSMLCDNETSSYIHNTRTSIFIVIFIVHTDVNILCVSYK